MEISKDVLNKYNVHYINSDTYWRELGGKIKFDNICKVLSIDNPKNIAEIGAGDGSILAWFDKANFSEKLFALEISESAIQKIEARRLSKIVDVVKFDGYKIPFENNFFDLIVCSHVLEHVEFPRMLLREIKRVSKFQVFEVPIDFSFKTSKKINHFLSYGHINIYTPDLFNFLLKSEAFEIINEHYSMYPFKMLRFIFKNRPFSLSLALTKKVIFNLIPVLKRIKPNAYTVMCKSSERDLEIFGN